MCSSPFNTPSPVPAASSPLMKLREYSMCVRRPFTRPCFSYLCASAQFETRCEVSARIRVCRLCLIVRNWQCLRGVLEVAYMLIPQGRVQWSWITKEARHAPGKTQTLFHKLFLSTSPYSTNVISRYIWQASFTGYRILQNKVTR